MILDRRSNDKNSKDNKKDVDADSDVDIEKECPDMKTGDNADEKPAKDKESSSEEDNGDNEDIIQDLECEISQMEEEIKNKDIEIDELRDIMARRQADFENFKKRIKKSVVEDRKLLIKDFALDVININDDLLRAIEAASNASGEGSLEKSFQSFIDGVLFISKSLEDVLQKFEIVEIDSLNQEFDPVCHEAVEIDMSVDVDKDTITKVYQKGFRLNDFIIRSTKVRVSKPICEEEKGDTSEDIPDGNNEKGLNDCSASEDN